MTKYLALSDDEVVAVTAGALASGEPVIVPTDTVYGLAALPSSATAIDRLFHLKDRPPTVPIAMLVGSVEQAESLFEPSDVARRLGRVFWPGPLTIVMTRLGSDGTVGVRYPDHEFIQALTERTGPLSVTSANRHGEPTPSTARAAAAALVGPVAVVVDGGPCDGQPSTVVDVTHPDLVIIREGSITEEQIRAVALR